MPQVGRPAQLVSNAAQSSSLKPDVVLVSTEMARSTTMPTFTAREDKASKEKDEALAITRGETLIWLDDASVRCVIS